MNIRPRPRRIRSVPERSPIELSPRRTGRLRDTRPRRHHVPVDQARASEKRRSSPTHLRLREIKGASHAIEVSTRSAPETWWPVRREAHWLHGAIRRRRGSPDPSAALLSGSLTADAASVLPSAGDRPPGPTPALTGSSDRHRRDRPRTDRPEAPCRRPSPPSANPRRRAVAPAALLSTVVEVAAACGGGGNGGGSSGANAEKGVPATAVVASP